MCRMEQELHTETETKCHDGEWVSIPKQEPFQTPEFPGQMHHLSEKSPFVSLL